MKHRHIITWLSIGIWAVSSWATGAIAQGTNIEQRLQELEQEIQALKQQGESAKAEAAAKTNEAAIVKADQEGFSIASADGNFRLRLRGQVQADSRWYLYDSARNGTDTFLMRRARPIVEGTLFRDFDFRLMPDFGNDTTALYDAYVEWKYLPWLKVRAGKFKPPVGLEQLQEDQYTLFTERAFPTDLVPNRDIGVQLRGDLWDGVVQYQAGVFNGVADGVNGGLDNNDSKDFEGRIFFEPFKKTKIDPLEGLGLGIAGTVGDQDGSTTSASVPSFKTPGQNTFFKYLSGTTLANTTYGHGQRVRVSPQGYYYWGPFGLLAEYVFSEQEVQKGAATDHLRNAAWQAAGSVVLTGERASYRGVTPRRPFDLKNGGWGALELAARYSVLRIDPEAFPTFASIDSSAQEARAWAVGLNWYLNRNVKFVLDYEETSFDGGAAGGTDRLSERVLFTRAQVAF
ncbi:MAG TPA: porin [Verrucomicrobiae bacterium]|nr:porin [Verrucomicrobiae bacterium]